MSDVIVIQPSLIRYTQDSISWKFRDGRDLAETFEQLLYGRIGIDSIPRIKVVYVEQACWALTGNRRLYIFRRFEQLGLISVVSVNRRYLEESGVREQFSQRCTTKCEGLSIECRYKGLEKRIEKIIREWRKSREPRSETEENDVIITEPSLVSLTQESISCHPTECGSSSIVRRDPESEKQIDEVVSTENKSNVPRAGSGKKDVIVMKPSLIRFTQESISCRFVDGRNLAETFEQLLYGRIRIDCITNIEVVYFDQVWWALTGNKRLYIFQRLEQLGLISVISVNRRCLEESGVKEEFLRLNSTKCGGSIIVLRDPELEKRIDEIICKWKKSNGPRFNLTILVCLGLALVWGISLRSRIRVPRPEAVFSLLQPAEDVPIAFPWKFALFLGIGVSSLFILKYRSLRTIAPPTELVILPAVADLIPGVSKVNMLSAFNKLFRRFLGTGLGSLFILKYRSLHPIAAPTKLPILPAMADTISIVSKIMLSVLNKLFRR